MGWDDAVPKTMMTSWKRWINQSTELKQFQLQRCIFENETKIQRTELHTFTDASEEAYAAAVYIRKLHSDEIVTIQLIMAKTKLCPRKTISVAKAELNAALLGARLLNNVKRAINRRINRLYPWTDSSCVRNWIRAPVRNYMTFVAHRIGEIPTITGANEWRIVPGRLNRSDQATRAELTEEKSILDTWTKGLDFLYEPEEKLPTDLP